MSETNPINETVKILLPVIRKIYPTLIAQSIIGVQPMVAPSGFIFKSRFEIIQKDFKMTNKLLFRNFLRLNDKKKSFSEKDMIKAKYPLVRLTNNQISQRNEIFEWCDSNIGKHSWVHNGHNVIVFSNEQDETLYKMVWND